MKKTGKKITGAFRKATGLSSGRSHGGSSSHRSLIPASSVTREPKEYHDEHVESQALEEQAEEPQKEAPDDSHIEL